MSGQIPNSFLMPMNKNVLQNMKYDGNAMSRHKKIKNFYHYYMMQLLLVHFKVKVNIHIQGKNFFLIFLQ